MRKQWWLLGCGVVRVIVIPFVDPGKPNVRLTASQRARGKGGWAESWSPPPIREYFRSVASKN